MKAQDFFPYFDKEIEFEDNRSLTMPFKGKGTVIGIRTNGVELRVNNNVTQWYPIRTITSIVTYHIEENTTPNKVWIEKYKKRIAELSRQIKLYESTGRGGACINITGKIEAYNAVIKDLQS